MSKISLLKVATPPLAVAVKVLPLAKPPDPIAIFSVTLSLLSPFKRLPKRSSTYTVTAGLMATPAVVTLGGTPKARWFAAAGTTVKLTETGPVTLPVALSPRV